MIGARIKYLIDQIKTAQREYNKTQAKLKSILNIPHPSKFLISEDHASFWGSRCCPICSIYDGRVFSVSGKDKRFPPLVSLPDEIHDGKCDVCNCYYTLGVWFEGVSEPDIAIVIQQSNAPLVDRRTPEQIEDFEKRQAKAARRLARQQANDIAPKAKPAPIVSVVPQSNPCGMNIHVQSYSGDSEYGKAWVHPDVLPLLWFADGVMRNIDVKKESLISSYTDDFCTVKTYGAREPSALYKKLPIRKPTQETIRPPYYPSYEELTPEQRYKYLEFLATPYEKHDMGYVFLFYYGLERHLLSGDFDRAFDIILKLRDVHANASFQKYSANALALSSIVNNRPDRFVEFIQSTDKAHEMLMYPHLYVLIKYVMKQPLLASDLMRLSSSFGFTNKRYINAHPEMFEAFLNEIMEETTGEQGFRIPTMKPSRTELPIFANVSLIRTTICIPDFFSNNQFFGEGLNLLQKAHDRCKAELARQRKAIREQEKQANNNEMT